MDVLIAGAGVSGSLLSRLLSPDHDVSVFDARREQEIGQDCAWATGKSEFERVCGEVGLDPGDYVLHRAERIISSVFSNRDAVTFEKASFLKDLRAVSGADFSFGVPVDTSNMENHDLVVDATAKRKILGGGSGYIVPCYQIEVEGSGFPGDILMELKGGTGYLWSFPQGDGGYRVGCGLLNGKPKTHVDSFLGGKSYRIIGNRSGSVRLSSPLRESVYEEIDGTTVVGVGESAGTVCPISGEGIVPSMRSAEILSRHISDEEDWLPGYESALRREFGWVESQLRFVESLRNGGSISQLYRLIKAEVPDYLSGRMSKLKMALGGW